MTCHGGADSLTHVMVADTDALDAVDCLFYVYIRGYIIPCIGRFEFHTVFIRFNIRTLRVTCMVIGLCVRIQSLCH